MSKTFLVGIGGGTGSGKGTVSGLIATHLEEWGLRVHEFCMDDCYKSVDYLSSEARDALCFNPERNYDHPDMIDFERLEGILQRMRAGEEFSYKKYDFNVHMYGGEEQGVEPQIDVALVEGNFGLYSGNDVGKRIVEMYDYKLFVTTNPQIAQLRRIRRDIKERGREVEHITRQMETTVIPMSEMFINPTRYNANDIIDWHVHAPSNSEVLMQGLTRTARMHALRVYESVKGPLLAEVDVDGGFLS